VTTIVDLRKLKKKLGAEEYRRRVGMVRRACAALSMYDEEEASFYAPRFEEVILRMQVPEIFVTEPVIDRMQMVNSLIDHGLIQ